MVCIHYFRYENTLLLIFIKLLRGGRIYDSDLIFLALVRSHLFVYSVIQVRFEVNCILIDLVSRSFGSSRFMCIHRSFYLIMHD